MVFMDSSQSCVATLIQYPTEPLTTGSNFDPLLLLLALAGDVHPNRGLPSYPCSVRFKNITSQYTSNMCTRCLHWVHSRCAGLQNVEDYRRANGWICTTCDAPSPTPSPAHTFHHVRQGVQHTSVKRQWHRQQTDETKHLPRGAQRQSNR